MKARSALERVRGTPDVEAEFADIVEAHENSKTVNKFAIFQKKYRPVLVSNHTSRTSLLRHVHACVLQHERQCTNAFVASKPSNTAAFCWHAVSSCLSVRECRLPCKLSICVCCCQLIILSKHNTVCVRQ